LSLVASESYQRIGITSDDCVRILLGNLLDLHTTFGAGHDHNLASRAVHHRAHIGCLLDIGTRGNKNLVSLVSLDIHTTVGLGGVTGFIAVLGDLPATSLASTARMHLGLNYDNAAELGGDCAGFFWCGGNL